jgi:hypothetical protein
LTTRSAPATFTPAKPWPNCAAPLGATAPSGNPDWTKSHPAAFLCRRDRGQRQRSEHISATEQELPKPVYATATDESGIVV